MDSVSRLLSVKRRAARFFAFEARRQKIVVVLMQMTIEIKALIARSTYCSLHPDLVWTLFRGPT
jgi:hypothetical protein